MLSLPLSPVVAIVRQHYYYMLRHWRGSRSNLTLQQEYADIRNILPRPPVCHAYMSKLIDARSFAVRLYIHQRFCQAFVWVVYIAFVGNITAQFNYYANEQTGITVCIECWCSEIIRIIRRFFLYLENFARNGFSLWLDLRIINEGCANQCRLNESNIQGCTNKGHLMYDLFIGRCKLELRPGSNITTTNTLMTYSKIVLRSADTVSLINHVQSSKILRYRYTANRPSNAYNVCVCV